MRQGTLVAGRFVLEHRAAAGGMGEVWKALDQGTGRPVAVKILPRCEPDDASRFAREARILWSLDHPHVVEYVSHGASDDGVPYLVMEWLEGEDLAARLSRGRLGVDESVALALAVADTLAFAHARCVVHRDLKPANLFLLGGRADAVKVVDFGIARAAIITRITRPGTFMGTPGYMASEQARGAPEVDARADVFSLGCVLYECLTGVPAFDGPNASAILSKVLFEETPSARALRPDVSAALDALIGRMLAKQREDRPQDGAAVAAALRALERAPAEVAASPEGEPLRAPEPQDVSEPRTASPDPVGLTSSEQRATAVILVGPPAHAGSLPLARAVTVDLGADAALLREASRFGGSGERLLDGSVVVIMAGSGVATDLCAQAARCALALRAHAFGRSIALTMGRVSRAGSSLGAVIDGAARLSAAAAPEGAVALDDVAAGLLDARFEVREADGLLTLHGERALAGSARLLLGKATPCVGRERELGTLRELFIESAEQRVAQAALITAPAGAGKSRVAQELLQELSARCNAASIWAARGDAPRAGSPFGMLGQALRSACGLQDSEPLEVRRERLLAEVGARVAAGEQRRVAGFLGEIMGAPLPDDDDPPLRAARRDAQLMASQVRAAFLDYLAAACARGPVLVLLEDLHWGDRPTVQLLDAALRGLAQQPLFVLAMARPEIHEVFPKLWTERRLHEIRLHALSRRAAERLARHALGPGADPVAIARIVTLSEGNAFYLEELIRWTAEGEGPELPETVVAMVASRLASLDHEARRLLRAASVFGEVFWAGGVAALAGAEARRRQVLDALEALSEREILVRRRGSRFPGEDELAFRHALLREGAYATLTEEDRALGHRLAGEWLEARSEEDARALAEHFEKGGDGPAAGRYYLNAARRASWGGDVPGAMALSRRGLALPLPDELRVQLLGALCEESIWQTEAVVSVLPQAEELVRIAARGSAAWLQGMLIQCLAAMVTGRIDEALAHIGELRRVTVVAEAATTLASVLISIAVLLHMVGGIGEADALVARLQVLAQTFGEQEPVVAMIHHTLAWAQAGIGEDPYGSLEHARACEALARRHGHLRLECLGRIASVMSAWYLGVTADAEQVLREVPLPDTEFGVGSSYRPFTLAWLLAERGEPDRARDLAEGIVASGRARGLAHEEGRGRWILAEVLRRTGALEAADSEAQAALAMLGAACPTDAPGALATLAALRLSQGRADEAVAAAEDGMARYRALGACGHLFRGSFLRLVHVESLDAVGRREAARAALMEARDRLLSIAARIGDPAYRESFLENVPENRRTLALAREWLGDGA